jgi:predicted HTH domain antitoxin
MSIEIEVPEDVAERLEAEWGNVPRRVLEALALEAYRSSIITEGQAQKMLGFTSRWEIEDFLKRAHAYTDYTESDLERDIRSLREVLPQ